MKTNKNTEKIYSFIRYTAALILALSFHLIFLFFFPRKSSAALSVPHKTEIFIIDENHSKIPDLDEIINFGNPSLFVKPDRTLGFSSIIQARKSLPEKTEIKKFIPSNEFIAISNENIAEKNKTSIFASASVLIPFFSEKIFSTELLRISVPHKIYPLAFDSYGRKLRIIEGKLHKLDLSYAESPTIFEISKKAEHRFPSFSVKQSSGDENLDKQALNIIRKESEVLFEKYQDENIVITIYWKE